MQCSGTGIPFVGDITVLPPPPPTPTHTHTQGCPRSQRERKSGSALSARYVPTVSSAVLYVYILSLQNIDRRTKRSRPPNLKDLLMLAVRRMMFPGVSFVSAISCLPSPVCRLMSAISCLPSHVCRLLSAVSCLPSHVCRLMSAVSCLPSVADGDLPEAGACRHHEALSRVHLLPHVSGQDQRGIIIPACLGLQSHSSQCLCPSRAESGL